MTKTCGTCGHPGLDDQAQFCNRCGSAVPEGKKPVFPVCPGCGTVVSDELAQFCNRCGTKIPLVPVVCSSCGSPAIDNQSRFCTRCGTTFEQKPLLHSTNCPACGAPDLQGQSLFCNRCGAPFSRQAQAIQKPDQTQVVITQRKPAGPAQPVTIPDTDWEPWKDTLPAPGPSGTPKPVTTEQPVHHDQQIAVPQKRYAHLPLVADDMVKKGDFMARRYIPEAPGTSRKKKGETEKKGILGFLKK